MNPKKSMMTVVAALIIVTSSIVALSYDTDAIYSEDYGTIHEIDIAPGFSYTCTPTYPSDLAVTATIEKYESAGLQASLSGNTLTVTVKTE